MPHHAQRAQQDTARRLGQIRFTLPGTISQRMMPLRQANLPLQERPPRLHGPYLQWTRTVGGKTITKLLTAEQLESYQP